MPEQPATKVIRVKPGTVDLPHSVSIRGVVFHFMPHAEVPTWWADHALKTQPNLYELPTGKPKGAYRYKEQFKNQTLLDLVESLSDEEKAEVYKLADGFRVARQEREHKAKLDADEALYESSRKRNDAEKKALDKKEREKRQKLEGASNEAPADSAAE